ncbi:BQ2448_1950 [Microbotryum intermedium]|uniref:BQ2448_1950 protein n=1 Tax=Microbotryum intermedium TaxID=269621 RepID=A0A238F4P2_9BASI|nr:BQ2448_1950 [Microbotryum intermedium]
MLKAKAKAAATAAKQKKLAAERAAAAVAAQQAQAAQAIPNPVVGPRTGNGRPTVTQYWVDNQSSMLAPGVGIQRIGYDQAAFEDAVRNVIIDPNSATFDNTNPSEVEQGEKKEKKDLATTTTTTTTEKEKAGAKEKEAEGSVDEEFVAVLTKEFDLSTKAAMTLLQQHQNDLPSTIESLLTPPSHPSAPSGRPASKLVSVSN